MLVGSLDTGLSRLQRAGHLFGHENVRVLLNEAVQLARSLEHTNIQGQAKAHHQSI